MIYFDSGMSKSTNTVVYFDWKTVIYTYTFIGACANEIIRRNNSGFFLAKGKSEVMLE